jgi:hypothetical protein
MDMMDGVVLCLPCNKSKSRLSFCCIQGKNCEVVIRKAQKQQVLRDEQTFQLVRNETPPVCAPGVFIL